ncbi:LANO_0B05314g1_1 [Lachancea nothofagi CBS 11611]|uniref:LANO_0B05314g1_1 n=1 Tax=Lachancea nothofagi CBS 11611 TaxID=1266666 RepID=A0A1G4IYJ9_9SACH|nr:LANO_0B05314g1_1 [Lachancea nothofagi CBS 11611]
MSSRALRRLQANSLEQTLANLTPESAENEPTSEHRTQRSRPVNPFALMGDEDEDEDEEEEEVTKSDNNSYQGSSIEAEAAKPIQVATKSKKKKNRKNKNKKASKKSERESEEPAEQENNENDDEELDRIIQQFQKRDLEYKKSSLGPDIDNSDDSLYDYDTANEDEEISGNQKLSHLTTDPGFTHFKNFSEFERIFGLIDMKKLNPDNEYKLLFDDLSPESLADVDSMTSTHVSPQVMKQIEILKQRVRNWGGKDHKSVPNGSTSRRLAFTKIRDDWIPTPRGEFVITQLSQKELIDWNSWQRPQDWVDEIERSIKMWEKAGINFFKFEPSNLELNRKAMTEFYMSVVLRPDHEALISLISSRFPYHVPALLQVALILVRQGDKANSNGLVERALFVFDRALRSHITFNGVSCQLPYIYFFNRQFYIAIFRYMQILSQRGAVSTASEWCKVLWSLSPLEDPLGCRYFIDHYLLMNKEYEYMLRLAHSPMANTYSEWYTLGLSLGFVLSYLKRDLVEDAKSELRKAFMHHPCALSSIFVEGLLGDNASLKGLHLPARSTACAVETKAYLIRMKALWGGVELKFLHDELKTVIDDCKDNKLALDFTEATPADNPFFIEGIPVNLLRFAVLSQESPLMACIPETIWSQRDVYEFDVLPPQPYDRSTEDLVESVKNFVSESDLTMTQMEMMQDENLLSQITQMSLEQFLEENPNAGIDE